MKKILTTLLALLAIVATANAQVTSTMDAIAQQKSLNQLLRDAMNEKPTKEVKKQAKELKKEGWKVPAGEMTLEQQLMRSFRVTTEPMYSPNGDIVPRFAVQTSMGVAGTYNAAYGMARANAFAELASQLETRLVAKLATLIDTEQVNTMKANTSENFTQQVRQIIDQSITNATPVMVVYRELPDHNIQVQVRVAFDRKEMQKRISKGFAKAFGEDDEEDMGLLIGEAVDELE